MAKTELVELESKVEKTLELKSLVKKDLVLQSLITGSIETLPNIPPVGTLTLNSIVDSVDPGEVLFDFTASDPDGVVAKIELLRKETAEPSFTEVAEILSPGATGQITDSAVPAGTFEYKLLITDNEGLTAESNIEVGIIITVSVIDFTGGDLVFSDGAFVPSSGTRLKAHKSGAAAKIEQLNDVGRTTTAIAAENAFFAAQNNVPGTWNIPFDLEYTAPATASSNFQTMAIMNSVHTVGFDPDQSDVVVAMVYDRFNASSANVRFQYNNGITTIQLAVFIGLLPFGQLIKCSIDKGIIKPGSYTFTFDVLGVLGSPVVRDVLINQVNLSRTDGFLHGPSPYITTGFPHNATMQTDNWGNIP